MKQQPKFVKHAPGKETDFYRSLEPGIREVVRLLRDHGFNTDCSCEHEMYVQCELSHAEEVERVYQVLTSHGYDGFRIEFVLRKSPGFPMRVMVIYLADDAYVG